MFILLVAGSMALFTVHQEEFPNIDPEVVTVNVPYLGAAPQEVEDGVCIRIEEAVEGIEGIEKIYTTASEGACRVRIELTEDAEPTRALNEIKSQVDGINTFPLETEKPIVSKLTIRGGVLQVAVSGDTDEATLKEIGRRIRDDIVAMAGVSQVELGYVRPYEISVEVSEYTLRRFGLTMNQVADAIRRTSLDMPGGNIKTEGGEILLRTKGQAYRGEEYSGVVVLTRDDGTKVTLGEIATLIDGFEEGDLKARFDGESAAIVKVSRVGKEDIIGIAEKVHGYVEALRPTLPPGLEVTVWNDESQELRDRVGTLLNNAWSGLLLVFLVLALFLRFRLALWVTAGVPIALLGAVATFPYVDISISSLTVMAFILVLGIVVDDAIVVGESVYTHELRGKPPIVAAIDGTREVSIPVVFGVLTTMAAFLPLIVVPGRMGDFFGVIGWVVIISLTFSLIESQFILPAHLAHRKREQSGNPVSRVWLRWQDTLGGGLERFARETYEPFLEKALAWRYVTAAVGLGVLILALGMIASGRVIFQFFPPIEGNRVYATLEMPEGTTVDTTIRGTERIERAAEQLRAELDAHRPDGAPSTIVHVLTSIGTTIPRGGPPMPEGSGRSHYAEIAIELLPLKERGDVSAKAIGDRWRELTGGIPDAVKLGFSADAYSAGSPIDFQLAGRDVDQLRQAAAAIRAELGRYDGVFDITDSFRAGKQEIKLSLLPEARNLGLTLNDLAQQVRYAFYGAEAQRIQRGPDDVRVMVRLPEDERRSIGNLEDMRIRTPEGTEVPFTSVARIELGRGYSSINRIDAQRVVNVQADVNRETTSPEAVIGTFTQNVLPQVLAQFPGVTMSLSGESNERSKAMVGLAQASVLALFVIFALLAIPLRSYIQPLIIMSVIPFGAVGAILGHYIMGWNLVFFSMLGIVALSGVVVNASLVLVDYMNRRRREGVALFEAVSMAGVARFRPIVLTSATTFIGLAPLMALANPSTAMIVPMAISLGFGVLFATAITLILVPCLYLIAEDFFEWGELARQEDLAAQQSQSASAG
jgi:multidrug efflux pump subunit AcrB